MNAHATSSRVLALRLCDEATIDVAELKGQSLVLSAALLGKSWWVRLEEVSPPAAPLHYDPNAAHWWENWGDQREED